MPGEISVVNNEEIDLAIESEGHLEVAEIQIHWSLKIEGLCIVLCYSTRRISSGLVWDGGLETK